ncbi:MAG: EpsG family protein, partial [Alishewanella aestuarii]
MTQFSHLPVSTDWRYISVKKLFLFLISILLILIAGFRPVGFDRDSIAYILLLDTPLNQADLKDKEPAFWLIVELNRSLFEGNERTFFLIFAILGVSLKIIAISRLSLDPILSLWIYICSYFLLHDMTQIRAGVASGIFLLSIQDMHNKNFKSF